MADTATFRAFADGFAIAVKPVAFIGGDVKRDARFVVEIEVKTVDGNEALSGCVRHRHPPARPRPHIAPQAIFFTIQHPIGILLVTDFSVLHARPSDAFAVYLTSRIVETGSMGMILMQFMTSSLPVAAVKVIKMVPSLAGAMRGSVSRFS